MEIKRDNFRFNRIINPINVINDSCLFCMEQDDMDKDAIVNCFVLEEGDTMLVFQNTVEPFQGERYCYIKINTRIGGDGHTKLITVDNIIVDNNLINRDLFSRIFTILLQQENNSYPNRIVVTNRLNECFRNRIDEVANEISNHICELYSYTSDLNPTYIIQ